MPKRQKRALCCDCSRTGLVDAHSGSLTRCDLAVTGLGAIAMHSSLLFALNSSQSIRTANVQHHAAVCARRLLTSSGLLTLRQDDRPAGISFSQGLKPTGACLSAFKKLHRITLFLSDATTSIFHLLVYLKRLNHCQSAAPGIDYHELFLEPIAAGPLPTQISCTA